MIKWLQRIRSSLRRFLAVGFLFFLDPVPEPVPGALRDLHGKWQFDSEGGISQIVSPSIITGYCYTQKKSWTGHEEDALAHRIRSGNRMNKPRRYSTIFVLNLCNRDLPRRQTNVHRQRDRLHGLCLCSAVNMSTWVIRWYNILCIPLSRCRCS